MGNSFGAPQQELPRVLDEALELARNSAARDPQGGGDFLVLHAVDEDTNRDRLCFGVEAREDLPRQLPVREEIARRDLGNRKLILQLLLSAPAQVAPLVETMVRGHAVD